MADSFNEKSREYYRMMTAMEYAHMTAEEFSKEDVVAMEKEIAQAIEFAFDTCTSVEIVNQLAQPGDKKILFLAEYLSDLTLLSSQFSP